MRKDQAKKLTAKTTRNILGSLLVIIILGSIAGFYFGLQLVKDYALEVSHAVTDSNASGKTIEQLGVLKQQLAEGQPLVTKANQLFSTPSTYQTQALKDISKYASEAGVTISGIDSLGAASESDPAATTPQTYSEVITIQSPVSYVSFVKFINAIEGNLPKMQITGISLKRPTAQSGDLIITDKITISVSVRES